MARLHPTPTDLSKIAGSPAAADGIVLARVVQRDGEEDTTMLAMISLMLLQLGSGFGPVGLLTLLALADARDGATLDDLRDLGSHCHPPPGGKDSVP